jgi:DNA repair exonuclease SbcCD ATPase subunit
MKLMAERVQGSSDNIKRFEELNASLRKASEAKEKKEEAYRDLTAMGGPIGDLVRFFQKFFIKRGDTYKQAKTLKQAARKGLSEIAKGDDKPLEVFASILGHSTLTKMDVDLAQHRKDEQRAGRYEEVLSKLAGGGTVGMEEVTPLMKRIDRFLHVVAEHERRVQEAGKGFTESLEKAKRTGEKLDALQNLLQEVKRSYAFESKDVKVDLSPLREHEGVSEELQESITGVLADARKVHQELTEAESRLPAAPVKFSEIQDPKDLEHIQAFIDLERKHHEVLDKFSQLDLPQLEHLPELGEAKADYQILLDSKGVASTWMSKAKTLNRGLTEHQSQLVKIASETAKLHKQAKEKLSETTKAVEEANREVEQIKAEITKLEKQISTKTEALQSTKADRLGLLANFARFQKEVVGQKGSYQHEIWNRTIRDLRSGLQTEAASQDYQGYTAPRPADAVDELERFLVASQELIARSRTSGQLSEQRIQKLFSSLDEKSVDALVEAKEKKKSIFGEVNKKPEYPNLDLVAKHSKEEVAKLIRGAGLCVPQEAKDWGGALAQAEEQPSKLVEALKEERSLVAWIGSAFSDDLTEKSVKSLLQECRQWLKEVEKLEDYCRFVVGASIDELSKTASPIGTNAQLAEARKALQAAQTSRSQSQSTLKSREKAKDAAQANLEKQTVAASDAALKLESWNKLRASN